MSEVLLFSPPQKTAYPQPPLGLASLAAVLIKNGHSVKIFDMPALGLNLDDVYSILKNERPFMVGITAMTPTISSAVCLAKRIKDFDPNIVVVLGGAHATILADLTLKNVPEIDLIVRGEGEETIVNLVNVLKSDGKPNFSQIRGITYRDGKSFATNPSRPLLTDLDQLPFPAFHLLPIRNYHPHPPFGKKKPFMSLFASRGCPYNCIFCSKSVFGKSYRANSVNYIFDEIRFLIDDFGVKEIKFYDDVFTLNKKWVIDLCRLLKKERLDVPWSCETRVNLVDSDLLREMRSAGCYMIAYGVESGNQQILDTINKKITLEQAITAFRLTNEAGIKTVGYFMIGCPEDTPETILDTIRFSKKLDPDFVQFSIATPYPGTELYSLASENCFLPQNWDEYVYADLKSFGSSSLGIKTLSRQELGAWNSKAYLSFYFRWRYLWKRLRDTRSFDDLRTNFTGLQMFLNAIT